MSYVANGGYIQQGNWATGGTVNGVGNIGVAELDYQDGETGLADTHRQIYQAASVFMDVNGEARRQSLSSMYDGLGSTFLFAENIQAGRWHHTSFGSTAFGIGLAVTAAVPTSVGVTATPAPATALQFQPLTGTPTDVSAAELPNGNLSALELAAPRASSLHPGGFVVSFCDGRATFLNDNLNTLLYVESMTPGGSRYGQNVHTNGEF